MSTYTPKFFACRGITLTPAGELALIAAGALAGMLWIAAMVLLVAAGADLLGVA